jgi:signal transduction histidine kinase
VLGVAYAVFRYAANSRHYEHPWWGWAYLLLLAGWTVATLPFFVSWRRCRWWVLCADLGVTVLGIALTRVLDAPAWVADEITLPTIFAAASILGFSVKGGWRPGAAAVVVVVAADNLEHGRLAMVNLHNGVILLIAGCAIGYVVEVARASEAALSRALRIEAVTRERERLARDIHDSVLQVLAMVKRRGSEAGGEAAELGRMAGEQEAALRALIVDGLPDPRTEADPGPAPSADRDRESDAPSDPPSHLDLRTALGGLAGAGVTLSAPGDPIPLPREVAKELTAAVAAALDNVRRHAGRDARAWILVEDCPEDGSLVVGIRDDGPGIPEGRLAAAEREGRLGVAQSIRGRLRDLGGGAEIGSVPGEGTEVELRIPRPREGDPA